MSEGFSSEVNPVHPNINNQTLVKGFNKGGFGSMSFGDYLLIIDLNNIQFWEGEPNSELRDWKGDLITDKWPWYGQIQSDVRQDLWLKHTLENRSYKHIIPFYHRGLFGGARLNMSHKNRDILKYWLPLFYKYNVKFITEAHDHLYKRTVPLKITNSQPKDTYMEQLPYKPLSWNLVDVPETYLEDYYTVNCIKNNETHEIVGWEFDGNYITYDKQGFIVQGDGGWAAGRRNKGDRQAGNAGWWFVDKSKGGEIIDGKDSYYLTVINLSNNEIEIESFFPNKLINFQNGKLPFPMKKVKWDFDSLRWYAFDIKKDQWLNYAIEE